MDAAHSAYLREHYHAKEWLGKAKAEARLVKGLNFENLTVEGWALHSQRTEEKSGLRVVHSIWRQGDSDEKLLSIDAYECASPAAARERLLELLGEFETDAMHRHKGAEALGDVHFAFKEATALFAQANVVVLIRNAGREIVPVEPIARGVAAFVGAP